MTALASEEAGRSHEWALDYLRLTGDRRWLPEFRRAVVSANSRTRIAGAQGIAVHERAEGLALLRRELHNRSIETFDRAAHALNALTGWHLDFDAHIPAERTRAIDAYLAAR